MLAFVMLLTKKCTLSISAWSGDLNDEASVACSSVSALMVENSIVFGFAAIPDVLLNDAAPTCRPDVGAAGTGAGAGSGSGLSSTLAHAL